MKMTLVTKKKNS